jgi:hypothetical protein
MGVETNGGVRVKPQPDRGVQRADSNRSVETEILNPAKRQLAPRLAELGSLKASLTQEAVRHRV